MTCFLKEKLMDEVSQRNRYQRLDGQDDERVPIAQPAANPGELHVHCCIRKALRERTRLGTIFLVSVWAF
ncbi:hypothetical protein Y032_0001g211 [Ancylostoma ceylanicum]|uniref:Uncharacterized protein n=1 Tax=Ancylostoma ceylanicum TaxID=53326 RepID=A0A016W4Z6_9BILA|nr:hypothetical protein Y032_0001g211 [Ancylostoma ceylanicum]